MQILRGLLILVGVAAVILLALFFVTHNQAVVAVNLLFAPEFEAKLAFWLIGFFIAGGLTGVLCSMPLLLKEKLTRLKLQRRLQQNSSIMSRL